MLLIAALASLLGPVSRGLRTKVSWTTLLDLLNEVCHLFDYWSSNSRSLLGLLFLLNSMIFLSLRTHVGVVTISLAVKAHDTFLLRVVFLICSQKFVQLVFIHGFFLAVR